MFVAVSGWGSWEVSCSQALPHVTALSRASTKRRRKLVTRRGAPKASANRLAYSSAWGGVGEAHGCSTPTPFSKDLQPVTTDQGVVLGVT